MRILSFLPAIVFIHNALALDHIEVRRAPSPALCSDHKTIVAFVHSAPANRELRTAIRETWGRSSARISTIFVVGLNEKHSQGIDEESEQFGDILQGQFVDSYRNLTLKHLFGYKWVLEHCSSAEYVLKTDDDQVVDTLHLPTFLEECSVPKTQNEHFFLCQLVPNQKPVRNVGKTDAKWLVTEAEYPHATYPPYCAGWAYVTNVQTIRDIIKEAESFDGLFWIDDVFVTGILAGRLMDVKYYDWSVAFLNLHAQYSDAVLRGKGFTPQLQVCSDIEPEAMKNVFDKMRACHSKKCYGEMYRDQSIKNEVCNLDPSYVAKLKDEL